ncbi:hypothetical protein KEJ27_03210 [Candidatus Bathyarchaeota archaeon]|nr:hypothetical protein [Candidatus Bathyarchaeota archaeon]MBS7613555.1 hypothetical protein [Candidatus Bathyarchaeota archaeon]MBS7618364.1 hypothetical protein [Candidatus Bathyarchaeota archaeon]
MEFWNEIIIDRSFRVLQGLKKKIDFILIGGWAVYFLTKALKSKDIDIIVDFENLVKIKLELDVKKTKFLKKYEAEVEGTSIDIYVPYYSEFAVPIEEIFKNFLVVEGFKIPKPEVLLILKQQVEMQRRDSVKGQKDRVDIICLAISGKIDWKYYKQLVEKFGLREYESELEKIVRMARVEFEYLGLTNLREIKKMKEKILKELKV